MLSFTDFILFYSSLRNHLKYPEHIKFVIISEVPRIRSIRNTECEPTIHLFMFKVQMFVFIPADIQHVYRSEGKYPNRGPGFSFIKYFRERRPDMFSQTTGFYFCILFLKLITVRVRKPDLSENRMLD